MEKLKTKVNKINCLGCYFNPENTRNNLSCISENQTIEGVGINCLDHGIIYLKRREKMENKMPELKAGKSVVAIDEYGHGNMYLFCGDILYNVDGSSFLSYSEEINQHIKEVYTITNDSAFRSIRNWIKLIWSKKSEKDQKIEEIQNRMDELKKELEELKGTK